MRTLASGAGVVSGEGWRDEVSFDARPLMAGVGRCGADRLRFGRLHEVRGGVGCVIGVKSTVGIVGLGVVSGYGWGVDVLWRGLLSGRSAARPVTFDEFHVMTRVVPACQFSPPLGEVSVSVGGGGGEIVKVPSEKSKTVPPMPLIAIW